MQFDFNEALVLFAQIKTIYKSIFRWNLDHMKLLFTDNCINIDGSVNNKMLSHQCPGCWTSINVIYLNHQLVKCMEYYNVKGNLKDFQIVILTHELAHEVWNNILSDNDKQIHIKAIRNSGFWSRYLDYVKKEKQDEELFCEYYANKVKRYIS